MSSVFSTQIIGFVMTSVDGASPPCVRRCEVRVCLCVLGGGGYSKSPKLEPVTLSNTFPLAEQFWISPQVPHGFVGEKSVGQHFLN